MTGTGQEWYYHWKADELKRVNPSALVPTLIPIDENTGLPNEQKVVYESLITIDFIDAVSGATGKDRLVPEDPYAMAQCRFWTDKVNRECCSPYYGVLVRKEESERRHHMEQLLEGLQNFSQQVEQTSGPLFLSDGQLSNVDLALLPWAFRFYVLEHYRGPDFAIPDSFDTYHRWLEHMVNLPSVQRTLPDKDRYLEHIFKYADGSARSKVANAVRRGASAHEIDDKKDEY